MAEPDGDGSRDSREKPGSEPQMVSVARYSGLGLQWVGAVGLFMAGGVWLDRKLGTDAIWTLIGAFVGGAAGFYSLYVHLVKGQKGRKVQRGRDEGPTA